MPKQMPIAALRDAVRSSGFTPGLRETEGLVELLGDHEPAVVEGAERAFARAGVAMLPRLFVRMEGAAPDVRARAMRVVGRLAPVDAASARVLVAGLGDGDPRVRRAAANALGRLQGSAARDDIAAALLAAWDEAPELPLARAIAEAMGKLGMVEAQGRLESLEGGDVELGRIVRKASAMLRREGTRSEASCIDGERTGDFDVSLVLSCRAGLERIVAEELQERCPTARAIGHAAPGQVTAVWRGAPQELMTVRTMVGFAFALPAESCAEDDIETACVRALTSRAATQIFETWTSGTVRYRLEWDGRGHRRATTWRVVHALSEQRPEWVNDPTESTWQASVRVQRGQLHVRLWPRGLRDERFAYRLRDVPAASHPTIAAALVRASYPRADDVVWDPFAGSGTELIERARAGPYRQLIGWDIDPEALSAARANATAAEVLEHIVFDVGDARRGAPGGITSIVTNPPMGRRVSRDGTLAELLDGFTDVAARVLSAGGRVTWLSPLGGRTAARAEANGLRVTTRQPVDMGGFHAELQIWEKRA